MTQAETLIALAERVENLDGPDRHVDAEIDAALGWRRVENPTAAGGLIDLWHAPDGTMKRRDERLHLYTASLDAAMSLVPEGWVWTINQFPDKASAYLVNSACQMARPHEQYQATPALALTAAALRARAASLGEG